MPIWIHPYLQEVTLTKSKYRKLKLKIIFWMKSTNNNLCSYNYTNLKLTDQSNYKLIGSSIETVRKKLSCIRKMLVKISSFLISILNFSGYNIPSSWRHLQAPFKALKSFCYYILILGELNIILMNYSAAGELFEKIVKSEAILMKKIIKSACQRWYFYDNDDIQILFKTKNPWGEWPLMWGR